MQVFDHYPNIFVLARDKRELAATVLRIGRWILRTEPFAFQSV